MRLIETLTGTGLMYLRPHREAEIDYAIEVIVTSGGVIFGRGSIAGTPEAIAAAERAFSPIELVLDDGQLIDATVVDADAARGRAAIFMTGIAHAMAARMMPETSRPASETATTASVLQAA